MKKTLPLVLMVLIPFVAMLFAGKNLGDAEARINEVSSAPVQVLDLQKFHSEDDARDTLTAMGVQGRAIYKAALVQWDVMFPIFMCMTFTLLLFCCRNWWPGVPKSYKFIPLTTMILDFAENWQEHQMIDDFPNTFYGGTLTMLKWIGIYGNLFMAGGVIVMTIRYVRALRKPGLRATT